MGAEYQGEEKYLAKGWDEVDKVISERSSGTYLKIEDGKSALVSCVGKPEVYEKIFSPGENPSVRTKVDVYIPAENALKTWDMSKTVWEQLKRQRNRKGDDFVDSVLEVGRTGTTKETTRYWLEYVRQLSEAERDKRDAMLNPTRAPLPF